MKKITLYKIPYIPQRRRIPGLIWILLLGVFILLQGHHEQLANFDWLWSN